MKKPNAENKITKKNIEQKFDELVKIIEEYNNQDDVDSIAEMGPYMASEIANQCSWSYFEALGILEETVLRFREIALSGDEPEEICDDCRKKMELLKLARANGEEPSEDEEECQCDDCKRDREEKKKNLGGGSGGGITGRGIN